MNNNPHPYPSRGGRHVLGDDGEHIPAEQAAQEKAAAEPQPETKRFTTKKEVRNGTAE